MSVMTCLTHLASPPDTDRLLCYDVIPVWKRLNMCFKFSCEIVECEINDVWSSCWLATIGLITCDKSVFDKATRHQLVVLCSGSVASPVAETQRGERDGTVALAEEDAMA